MKSSRVTIEWKLKQIKRNRKVAGNVNPLEDSAVEDHLPASLAPDRTVPSFAAKKQKYKNSE